ncbi:MAG: sugar ABC transporter substrate-binding protein [Spirochaetes bacterium]|uniref:Sugar ABC transporter substrate-binding protein n=1 Tax=Candidatus Ornithospirochaeta stercoravium TaxID=2840897 RepID=A0A9D9IBU0_9SPIO|nr:sugar ABC transporter substrate-binding protein [Candidatus Ornithospirochaeta stercoravium]
MKRMMLVAALMLLAVTSVFAMGGGETSAESEYDRIVTTTVTATYLNETWFNTMNADFEAETGIHVVVQPVPGDEDEYKAKINIDLMGGSTVDVVETLGPKDYSRQVSAGFFMPLNEAVEEAGIDPYSIYGANLPVEDDGNYYALPFKQEMYCVFYNKAIFDEAGVPYPEGPWTWDEYVETAQKLTDKKKGVYGSFMNADLPWMYMPAQQLAVPFYKEDGSCNFDDPVFKEYAEWFKYISNDLGVQPSVAELEAENANWNYYALEGYRLAMFPQGNWFTRLLNSQEDYPKDWNYGVAPLPSAGEGGNNNLVSLGYVAINKNAAHPEEALTYALWIAENQWKYEGGIPAFATMSEEDQQLAFGSIAEASHGQVTVDDLYQNLINTGLGSVSSDIVGTAAAEYYNIVKEELSSYNMDLQDIDTAIANIVTRVNEAIANAE